MSEKGSYSVVEIFLFTDRQLTGGKNIEKATERDPAYARKWHRQIRGYYSSDGDVELGTVGYKDGPIRTKDFAVVFGTPIP